VNIFRRLSRPFRRRPCPHDWHPTGYFWLGDILVGIEECSVCRAVLVQSR
jgi:hypothetical protein